MDGSTVIELNRADHALGEGAEQLFGHTAVAAVGQPVDLIVPEHPRDAHWNGFRRAMERPEIKDMAADLPVRGELAPTCRLVPGSWALAAVERRSWAG